MGTVTTPASAQAADPVNKSIYGQTIPLLFGATKSAGAPIWAGPVVTKSDNTRVVTFAVMFGKRAPFTLNTKLYKVWVDGKLVMDSSTGLSEISYTFYDGSQSQGPSPDIAAVEGIANTPAFRGRIYLVIRNWTIGVGGAFPEVTALLEQQSSAATNRYVVPFATYPNVPPNDAREIHYTPANDQVVIVHNDNMVRVYDADNAWLITASPLASPGSIRSVSAMSKYGDALFVGFGSDFNTTDLRCYDAKSGAMVSDLAALEYPQHIDTTYGTLNAGEWIATLSIFGNLSLISRNAVTSALTLQHTFSVTGWTLSNDGNMVRFADMRRAPQQDVVMGYACNNNTITQFVLPDHAGTANLLPPTLVNFDQCGLVTGPHFTVTQTVSCKVAARADTVFDLAAHTQAGTTAETIAGFWTSDNGGEVSILTFGLNGAGAFYRYIRCQTILSAIDAPKYLVYNGVNLAVNDLGVNFLAFSQFVVVADVYIVGGNWEVNSLRQVPYGQSKYAYRQAGATKDFVVIDMKDGSYVQYPFGSYINQATGTPYSSAVNGIDNGVILDSDRGMFFYKDNLPDYPGYVRLNIGGGPNGNLALADLLTAYGYLSGYATSDISTYNISESVVGSILNQQIDFLQLAGDICNLYRIDIVETEGKIKFTQPPRSSGFTTVATLTDADLAPPDQFSSTDGTLLVKDRQYTADLPTILELDYLDSDNDFQVGMQTARRTQFPYKTSAGQGTPVFSVPIAMTTVRALYWVSYALFDTWGSALTLSGLISRQHLDLEPGDFIEIATANDGAYIVKLQTVTLNADWSMSFTAATVLTEVPAPDAVNGIATAGHSPPSDLTKFRVALIENIFPAAYNPTLLPANRVFLTVIADTAVSVAVYDNANKYTLVNIEAPARFGTIINDHPAQANYDEASDDITPLIVRMDKAVLNTSDDPSYLSGYNVAVIGDTGRWEVVYYRDVVQNSDGTWTISHLLRGRRGSDVAMLQQRKGDTFIAITGSEPKIAMLPTAGLPYNATVKAAITGSTAEAKIVTLGVTGGSIKPWSPVEVLAARAGSDVVFTWHRRDRQETDLLEDGDDDATVPLSEATESYTLEILNAAGTTVLRTVTGLTTPTYTYVAADIATDGLTSATVINIQVYQISAVVGRGYTRLTACPLI